MIKSSTATVITTGAAICSAAAWLFGYVTVNYGYYWKDIWFHVITYLLPIALLALTTWLLSQPPFWKRCIGAVVLLPSVAIWLLYMLLAASAFKIH